MKIVLDNIVFKLQSFGGISVYWNELIKYLKKTDKDITYIDNNCINSKNNDLYSKLNLPNDKIIFNNEKIKVSRYLKVKEQEKEKHIFHSSYYRYSNNKRAKIITTVWDFTYEKFNKGLKKVVHHWQKAKALKKSNAIVCISENTKKDMIRYFPWTANKRIEVIYCGVSDEYFKIEGNNIDNGASNEFKELPKKYILFIGGRAKYKNFDKAVGILCLLHEDYSLVVIGGAFNADEKVLIEEVKNRVKCFSNLSAEEINILYNKAFCLLYPSTYEGFGIPPLEAMKAGCPVVAFNASSIPEVIGNAGIMVNNDTEKDFSKAVISLENADFRQEIVERGYKQAQKFSWQKSFEQLDKLYEEIIKE